jgi:hypothetical protein
MLKRAIPTVLVLALLGGALVVATAASAGTTATTTHIFQAFNSNGKSALRVTQSGHGTCNGGAESTDRDDAWRCFSGNYVLDPCFSSAKAKGILLCPYAPWSRAVFELKLRGKLTNGDRGKASTSRAPWGIETTTGLKCLFATGATAAIGKSRLNYICGTGKDSLWGVPSRKSEPWTIYIASDSAKKLTRKVGVKTAWF